MGRSGALTRKASGGGRSDGGRANSAEYFTSVQNKRSRTVLTSGGLEPVLDSGGGIHSVFAKAFIDVLDEGPVLMDGIMVFEKVRRRVCV